MDWFLHWGIAIIGGFIACIGLHLCALLKSRHAHTIFEHRSARFGEWYELAGDGRVRPLNTAARDRMLGGGAACLVDVLSLDSADDLTEILDSLCLSGDGFKKYVQTRHGQHLLIQGDIAGANAYIQVTDTTALYSEVDIVTRIAAEARFAQHDHFTILENAPNLQWRLDRNDAVVWSNWDSCAMARHNADLLPQLVTSVAAAKDRATAEHVERLHRVDLSKPDDLVQRCFDVTEVMLPGGQRLGYACDVSATVRAEASLVRFVETLTATFAHLPIGLAIFDRNRELGLFNPALANLLNLDPAWMAGRPSLESFLNQLREQRALPDQHNYRQWRADLVSLAQPGGQDTYSEMWIQPDGRSLRVTGRPHPQGAVAFLFEDITTAVSLEQQFRDRLVQREAALDRISGAHVLFDASGAVVHETPSHRVKFKSHLTTQKHTSIRGMLDHWRSALPGSVAWAEVLRFVAGGAPEREMLELPIADLETGLIRLSPLPNGGSLVSFIDPKAATPKSETFAGHMRRVLDHAGNLTEPADISLRIDDQDAQNVDCIRPDLVKRLGLNMILGAVDLVAPGTRVDVKVVADPSTLFVSMDCPMVQQIEQGAELSLPLSLLRRFLGEYGGTVAVVTLNKGAVARILAEIPREAVTGKTASQLTLDLELLR